MRTSHALKQAALNAATLARNSAGDDTIGESIGLSSDDLQRARACLELMQQDSQTSAFDRQAHLIASGWRPALLNS